MSSLNGPRNKTAEFLVTWVQMSKCMLWNGAPRVCGEAVWQVRRNETKRAKLVTGVCGCLNCSYSNERGRGKEIGWLLTICTLQLHCPMVPWLPVDPGQMLFPCQWETLDSCFIFFPTLHGGRKTGQGWKGMLMALEQPRYLLSPCHSGSQNFCLNWSIN